MNNHDKQLVARHFSNASLHYDENAILQKMVYERLLERLDLVKLEPSLVLDVGSGTGKSAIDLTRRYRHARVIEIDISQEMLELSRRKTFKWLSRRKQLCADAEYLPIKGASSQLVFSSLTYQWCNNLDQVFKETRRVLASGGLFMFSTMGPDTLKELRKAWLQADNHHHINSFFDMHDIGDALIRAGLQGVVMDVEHITITYKNSVQLMRDLKLTGAAYADEARQKSLTGKARFQRVIDAYEKFRQPEGLPATYEIIYGHAWAHQQQTQTTGNNGEVYVPISNLKQHGQ